MASDLGIVANTLALAFLLHRRQLVRINELNWGEIGKAGITGVVAGLLSYQVARVLLVSNSRVADHQSSWPDYSHMGRCRRGGIVDHTLVASRRSAPAEAD